MKQMILLLAAVALADHTMKITISCDNKFTLYLPGQPNPIIGTDFTDVKTYNHTLTGKGPWVVSIIGEDFGVISGLFAGVSVDGSPYAATGNSRTMFMATTTKPESNWMSPNYNPSSWSTGPSLSPPSCQDSIWDRVTGGQLSLKLKNQMPEQTIKASWLPDCSTVNNVVYFRLLIKEENIGHTDAKFIVPNEEKQVSLIGLGKMVTALPEKLTTLQSLVRQFDQGLAQFKSIFELNLPYLELKGKLRSPMTEMQFSITQLDSLSDYMTALVRNTMPVGQSFSKIELVLKENRKKGAKRLPFSKLVAQIRPCLTKTIYDYKTQNFNPRHRTSVEEGLALLDSLGNHVDEKKAIFERIKDLLKD